MTNIFSVAKKKAGSFPGGERAVEVNFSGGESEGVFEPLVGFDRVDRDDDIFFGSGDSVRRARVNVRVKVRAKVRMMSSTYFQAVHF